MANGVGSAAGRSKRDQMPKQIRLNAFDMNCVGHQSPGLWTHPRDRSDRYNTWLPRLIKATSSTSRFARDLYGAFPVKRLFLGFSASSLFGAGKAVLRPVACDQVPGARGRGQGTETLA